MLMRRFRVDGYLLLLFALTLPALAPLAAPGYFFDAHDGRHSVFYLIQFDASLRDGAFWPRWAMHHIQGYGYPTFLIQAPLGFFLGELFVLLGAGFTLAAKLTWAVGMLASAWGMYALVRHWLGDEDAPGAASALDLRRLTAVAAGVLYVYFPYHLADMYVRGALNDTLLLAWLPWLLLAFDRLLLGSATHGWPRRLAIAILVLAGTLLTHTFALLSIAPLLVTFVLFRLAQQGWHARALPWRTALLAAAGGIGALLLTSIFLLPLLAEGQYLQQQVYVTDTYDFRNHFVQFGQFFSPFWGFGFSDDPAGANDGMGFQLGALLALLGIVGLLVVGRATRQRATLAYLLAAGVTVLLLMTPLAQPLWESVSLLAVIQFPWRLLALAGFLFSAAGGLVLWHLLPAASAPNIGLAHAKAQRREDGATRGAPAGGLLVMALLGVFASWPYIHANLAPVEPWREDGRAIFRFEQAHPDMIAYTAWVTAPFTATAMTADYAADDYREVQGVTESLTRFEVIAGDGEVLHQVSRGASAEGVVRMATPGVVRINHFYFPGWQVTLDGAPAAARPSPPTGAIEIDAPAGEHIIIARFGATPPRTLGAVLSGLALLGVFGLLAAPTWRRRE
jgi:hypothetical protein